MTNTPRKTIAVIFGGRSAEHDVSIITAHNPIIDSLTALGTYEIIPVYISKTGVWYSDKAMNDMAFFKNPEYEKELTKTKPISISVNGGLELIWSGLRDKRIKIDVVFPSMHGTFGEDGSLMGLLRMANVPFVGCDIFASAVAMDKVLTKDLAKANDVPVVPHVWFTKSDWTDKTKRATLRAEILKLMKEEISAPTPAAELVVETVATPAEPVASDAVAAISELSEVPTVVPAPASAPTPVVAPKPTYKIHPMFVKPVHLGSSIGITKVKTEKELDNAIEVALHYDDKVLVEVGVENLIEVTLPMIGNDVVEFAAIERPMNKADFFDFNDKYMAGGKKGGGVNNQYSEIPANISDELSARVREVGEKTYKTLGCSGIARVDMLIDSVANTVYMNEVNTLPGSLYQHNWRRVGVSNVDLITKLIGFAEARFEAQAKVTHTFNSGILQKAGGGKKLGN